jgi:hypothetical protein
MRFALVSCVKLKAAEPRHAKDLYVSPLFRALRAYAEASAEKWFILSAKHGLVHPETVVAPYERTLMKMRSAERHEWANRVSAALTPILQSGDEVIMLAGERYREGLLPWLSYRGVNVTIPLAGLKMGQQLQRLGVLNKQMRDGHP